MKKKAVINAGGHRQRSMNKGITMKKQLPTTKDLIKIAGRLSRPIKQMDQPVDELMKLLGRYTGVENDPDALYELVIDAAQNGSVKNDESFFMVQWAIETYSDRLWEKLWNEKHPDRYGKAFDKDSEDFDLMEVWRTKVRAMLKDCHQDAVLDMTYDEYVAKLTRGKDNKTDNKEVKEAVESLANWMNDLDLLNAREQGTTGIS